METRFEYSVMNYMGNVIGPPTNDPEEAERRRDSNQRIANALGEGYYNYRVVKRRVIVGRWLDA